MTVGVVRVCPNCGNNQFYTKESVQQLVVVDSSGMKKQTLQRLSSTLDEWLECTSCKVSIKEFDDLVSDAQFHEVIACQVE